MLATVCWGIWGFALKKAIQHMPPLAAYIVFGSMGIILVPVYATMARRWNIPLKFPPIGSAWIVLAAIAVGIGTVSLLYAMREREASTVVALTGAYPIVTLGLSVLLLGEALTVSKMGGVAAIGLGVYLLTR